MKLITFIDHIGRIVAGEELTNSSTKDVLVVKNPVICSIMQNDPNQPAQLSILPYCPVELMDLSNHEDWHISFNRDNITMVESVGINPSETNNMHANLISNYTNMHNRIRDFKNRPVQQPSDEVATEQTAPTPAAEALNVVEVKE